MRRKQGGERKTKVSRRGGEGKEKGEGGKDAKGPKRVESAYKDAVKR